MAPVLPRLCALVCLAMVVAGCSFQSTSRRWNGRLDPDDRPVHYKSVMKVGINFLVFIPCFGDMSIDGLVNDMTQAIADEEGEHVRIIQGDSENYWHGYPPFTWIATPVISTVTAEFEPSEEKVREQAALEASGDLEPRWYFPWTW